MAKGRNQKLKLLYLMRILLENTDEEHSLTMTDLIQDLKAYDIEAERKSIYSDLEALRAYGIDIIGEKLDKTYRYHVGNREFELAELKLLVDSVQASKFITGRKSKELIKKLEGLASKYEARHLHRQIYSEKGVKTMNEGVYYNVDKIHTAIITNTRIRFQYFQWNVDKSMELRRGGAVYCISPWALVWTNENYYLLGFDSEAEQMKHYRVDKMLKMEASADKREGRDQFELLDMSAYVKQRFGMFDGRKQRVKLECENRFAGVLIDRFGREVEFRKKDSAHFIANVNVAVSRKFLAWVMALGDGVRILAPKDVTAQMRAEIARLARVYMADEESDA